MTARQRFCAVIRWMSTLVSVLALTSPACAAEMPPDYGFQWALIDHPGNAPFTGPFQPGDRRDPIGRVDYTYRISKTEMTAADWAPFASAQIAIGDPWHIGLNSQWDGVLEAAPSGGLRPRTDLQLGAQLPLRDIAWYAAAMYCNWLHNGQTATREAMEYGAYDLRGLQPNTPLGRPVEARLPGAKFFLPTRDEWVKAGFFDPNRYGDGQPGYWQYPTTSNTQPVPGPPGIGETNAGYSSADDPLLANRVGRYPGTQSPWGLLDLSGGRSEWLESTDSIQIFDAKFLAGRPGMSPGDDYFDLDRLSVFRGDTYQDWFGYTYSFRIASVVPSPAIMLMYDIPVVGLILVRRRKS